ncbi:MAG TPA: DNA gyrase inhibitor YacG [Caulobacteraceae bacterium]|jgi:hypothetical protein|nr:DNA gyrase inhibitor YacG [Caulobacteraceae bacterium]
MSGRKCPICGRPTEPAHRPFCSRRCADLDLQRWLSNGYRVPSEPDDSEADSASRPPLDDEDD